VRATGAALIKSHAMKLQAVASPLRTIFTTSRVLVHRA